MYRKEEAKKLREKFWTDFYNKSARLRLKNGKPRKWMLYKTGIKGVELKFDLTQKNMSVMIEIFYRNVYTRLEVFEKFEQVRALISEAYEGELTWDDNVVTEYGKEVCQIYERNDGVNIHDQGQWDEIMNWLMTKMLSLENAFEEVHSFLKSHIEEVLVDK